jgi:hypothetical protein
MDFSRPPLLVPDKTREVSKRGLDSVPHEATRFDVTGEAAGMKYQEHGIQTSQQPVELHLK